MKALRPNVFVVAFVLGALALTALPFLQKRFLKAPPPIRVLPAWALQTSAGEAVGSASLQGRVWLASFAPSPCAADCTQRQEAFGRALPHLEDLDGGVVLVTLSMGAPPAGGAGWYAAADAGTVVEQFRQGWVQWAGTDAGSSAEEFARLPGVAVVDQQGALRGFWKDDAEGRGNAINAARLLWRYGPAP